MSAALWGPQQQILFFLSGTILKKWREKWKISQSERVTSYRWLVTAKIISLNLVLFPVTWLWALKSSFLSFDHESVRLRRQRGRLLQVNNYQKDLFVHYIMDFFIYGRNCYIWPAHMRWTFLPLLCHTNSLNICKTLRKYLFRHAKGKSMVNFYIFNAIGQNFANSESCPILRLR